MRDISPVSPEARRKRLASMRAAFGTEVEEKLKPRLTAWEVVKRVAIGVYNDGFIHAGNLAYLSIVALFPFFIVAAAVAHLLGQSQDAMLTVTNVLRRLPPDVAATLREPVQEVLTVRTGTLLWLGAIVGLWTATSFVETIRDILRRAYGVKFCSPFWEYRLGSMLHDHRRRLAADAGVRRQRRPDPGASADHSLVSARPGRRIDARPLPPRPGGDPVLHVLRAVLRADAVALSQAQLQEMARRAADHRLVAGARSKSCRACSRLFGGYSRTYGSLAGVMIALIFFFVVGLGVVIGAELNAALAESGATALKGEIYTGPYTDELEVEEPQPGEDVEPVLQREGPQL